MKQDQFAAQHFQIKHLRFAFPLEEGGIDVRACGGYTLAFRLVKRAENDLIPTVEYSYVEFPQNENYNRKAGRHGAAGLLAQRKHFMTFPLVGEEGLPEEYESHLILQSASTADLQILDIPKEVFDLNLAVVRHFLSYFADRLDVGTGANLLDNLFVANGTTFIDADVLFYDESDFADPGYNDEDVSKAIHEIIDTSTETLELLEELGSVSGSDASTLTISRENFQRLSDGFLSIMQSLTPLLTDDSDEEDDFDEDEESDEELDDSEADDASFSFPETDPALNPALAQTHEHGEGCCDGSAGTISASKLLGGSNSSDEKDEA